MSRQSQKTGGKTVTKTVPIRWCSPELINHTDGVEYSFKSDIWAFGCCILELLDLTIPFEKLLSQFEVVTSLKYNRTPAINESWDESIQHLLKRCWSIDPANRPTALEVFQVFKELAPNKQGEDSISAVSQLADNLSTEYGVASDVPDLEGIKSGLRQEGESNLTTRDSLFVLSTYTIRTSSIHYGSTYGDLLSIENPGAPLNDEIIAIQNDGSLLPLEDEATYVVHYEWYGKPPD